MKEKSRSSQYLVDKCLALRQALEYFGKSDGAAGRGIEDKLMIFLAQIDFWEWEVENLTYSFQTFCERQDAWDDPLKAIRLKGFTCRPKSVEKASWRRYARRYNERTITVPLDSLNDAIKQWNLLLDECRDRILNEHKLEQYRALGADLISIEKYRRELVTAEIVEPAEKEPTALDHMAKHYPENPRP